MYMMYLWPQPCDMSGMDYRFGVMTSIANTAHIIHAGIKQGRWWALDNGMYTGAYDQDVFLEALDKLSPYREKCLFITCPDIVGDAVATIQRFHEMKGYLSGWPIAFVAQDGLKFDISDRYFYEGSVLEFTDYCDNYTIDGDDLDFVKLRDEWRTIIELDEFDWLFVGGTTEWKLSKEAARCIKYAKEHEKKVHVGRVNSRKRYAHFRLLGVDTCDGTNPVFEPRKARIKYSAAMAQMPLFLIKE